MLVDIDFIPFEEGHRNQYREAMVFHNATNLDNPLPTELVHPRRVSLGVYEATSLDQRTIVQPIVDDVPAHLDYGKRGASLSMGDYLKASRQYKRKMDRLYSQRYQRGPYQDFMSLGAYGLCDSPEQLFQRYPHLVDDGVMRVLAFHKISRVNQSPQGGFRYHKNGKYVGAQRPRHEYLYDDTHIDHIYGFHVYRVVKSLLWEMIR